MKATEGMFDESVVFVTRQGAQIRTDGGRIVVWDVESDDGELASWPTEKLDTINVFGGVNFSTPFVARANEHGIVLNYFNKYGKYRGSFVPERNTIAEVRRAQYALSRDTELAIAKRMIAAKVRNSRTLLSRKGVSGTEVLRDLGVRAGNARNKDELRGAEGEAAERYFARLDETLAALRQYNLDPFLGVFHADRHGRPSLALDLQEEFRPIFCDAFVTRLVNRGTITNEEFKKNNRLTDDAFKTYLSKFDDYMQEEFSHPFFEYRVSRRKAIRQQAILLRKAITGELDAYHALEFDR